ncbi:helix-turn-helix domain-containing protein [Amaricoccus sp. W119]|uniref:helix-turn-helix domain-containing protein n=1 Tax=Amaricoccus sp. W119 TaxID=3391833 RepID=UPI0039A60327
MRKIIDDPDHGVPEDFDTPIGELLRGERARQGRSLLDVQRDLRIKAAHVAAIEEMNLDGFVNRGVIPGYVRSYARYLDLEPEPVYHLFCAQTGFSSATFGAVSPRGRRGAGAAVIGNFHPDFPLAPKRAGFGLPAVPLSAIGSVLALLALIGGLGYGGWTVVRNIQRVQFAPVDEQPVAVAEVDDLAAPAAGVGPASGVSARQASATALSELYRDQEAAVPVPTPRDGPIAAIDPASRGPVPQRARPPMLDTAAASLPGAGVATIASGQGDTAAIIAAAVAANVAGAVPEPVPTLAGELAPHEKLTVIAERAAWIRVYLPSGTIVFERILEKGETYSPPDGLTDPKIWAGNSGSVYIRVGETLRGPLGRGTRAARDVPLVASALTETYPAVEQVPEVVSQSLGTDGAVVPAVAIQ